MLTFVCYPRCTTCQKARKWLEEHAIGYTFRDIQKVNPSAQELSQWNAASGLPMKKFFNTSGILYKSMNLKEKLPTMTEEEMAQLLATDGMLVKRPLLIGTDFVLVGFKQDQWEARLLDK